MIGAVWEERHKQTLIWWIERKEISINIPKVTLSTTHHIKSALLCIYASKWKLFCAEGIDLYWSEWPLINLFLTFSSFEMERERHPKSAWSYFRLIINLQVRKFAAKWPGGDERFCWAEINHLITRNLRSNHLHGDDIDFIIQRTKNVWIHIFSKKMPMMKTSLSIWKIAVHSAYCVFISIHNSRKPHRFIYQITNSLSRTS